MQEIKRIVLPWFGAGVEKGAIPAPKTSIPAPPKCAPTSVIDGHDALLIFRQLRAVQDFGFCMILSLFATD